MASADELRQSITASRGQLAAALEEAADRWALGTEEAWGPRRVAEHAIATEAEFAGRVSSAMGSSDSYSAALSLESAEDAIAGLVAAAAFSDGVFLAVTDADLGRPAEMSDESAEFFGRKIESVLLLAAVHNEVHSEQIARG